VAILAATVKRPNLRKLKLWLPVATLLCLAIAAQAQQPTLVGINSPKGILHKSKRHRSKVSKPADFTGAGLLQFEYGYDGDFRAPDADRDQAGTASVLFNATEDLQFEFDFDTFHALTCNPDQTTTGIGDAYFSAQFTSIAETQHLPSLAFAYLAKLPTADTSRGLGTGCMDHKLTLLASKKLYSTDIDFNASLLVNGNPDTHRWDTGYQLSLGLSRELGRTLSLQGEIFGETLDTDQPRGLFVQGGIAYQPSTRASYDLGIRAGLSSSTPRFGLFAGVSFALANFYEDRPAK
jgi:hypothetical protein